MKRRLAFIILLVFVFILFTFPVPVNAQTTYYVDDNGDDENNGGSGDPWATITYAVSQVSANDTIIVKNGTYSENIVLASDSGLAGLTIRSENGYDTTTVYSADYTSVFDIRVNNVTIDGFSIYRAEDPNQVGIYLNAAEGCVIQNNLIGWNSDAKNWFGIYLDNNANNNLITNNNCDHNDEAGIKLNQSNGNTIANNTNSDYSPGYGIQLVGNSVGNTISYNTLNYIDGWGIHLQGGCENNIIVGNDLSYNAGGIEMGANNNIIYLNSLVDNSAYTIYCNGSVTNTLTSPSKVCYFHDSTSYQEYLGNFYGVDYTGSDDGTGGRVAGDGIGDTNLPHDIYNVGDDYYPLSGVGSLQLVQAWYLSGDSTMYKADLGKGPGTVQLTASGGSAVWVSDEAASGVTFSNDNWTGQVVFTSAPAADDTFTVEIGSSTGGSNFDAGGPDTTITGDGSTTYYTYATDASQVSVSSGQYLAIKITNNSGNTYSVKTGGAWSYTSNPDTGAPAYPVPELSTFILLGTGAVVIIVYLLLKRHKIGYSGYNQKSG